MGKRFEPLFVTLVEGQGSTSDSVLCSLYFRFGDTGSTPGRMYRCMGQPGMIANAARGQLNGKRKKSLSPFAPKNLVSLDGFG